jgi:hypothetical protein
MVLAIQMALVFVIRDSLITQLPESVNTLALVKLVQTAMVLISDHAVQVVLVELATMALALAGLVLVEPTARQKCQSTMSMLT